MPATLNKTESREWVTIDNDGQQTFGVLHRLTETENPPIVLMMHESNRCYVILAEQFARAGIAALRFDDERRVEINGVKVEKLQFEADSVMVDALLYAHGEYSVTVSTFSNAKRQTPWDRSTICAFLFGLK